jgi:hypothetical protein
MKEKSFFLFNGNRNTFFFHPKIHNGIYTVKNDFFHLLKVGESGALLNIKEKLKKSLNTCFKITLHILKNQTCTTTH